VVAMEHPELRCVSVDLDPLSAESNVPSFFHEICSASEEDQVAFRQGLRYVARLRRAVFGSASRPAALSSSAPLPDFFKRDGTYLITGGLGDLGMRVARWMADGGVRHLVLLGRHAESAQAQEQAKELQDAGAEVVLHQGDVARREDVARLLSKIEVSMPPLRGIIHAAGVWKGGVLLQQDWNRFFEVLAPKVQGAWNLHELTQSMPLDFFVSFSSGATVLGAAGLGDYAAANSFLDALAHYRQAKGLPGASINWGPWADLGMVRSVTDLDTRRWSEHGMGYIPLEQALHALGEVIRQGTVQVSVLPINWVRLQSGIPSLANSPFVRELVVGAAKPEKAADARPAKKTLLTDLLLINDPAERQRILIDRLQAEAARVLRLPVSKLDVNRCLNQFGMDSLMALELKNRMQAEWGMPIPLATVLSGPPVAELAALLMAKLADRAANPDRASTSEPSTSSGREAGAIDKHEAQELLRKLPELSDDDVDSILSRMVPLRNVAKRGRQE
jgi:NAD(P)-dependent dehydrogenase (short-subunit alcohol dehydrogenase family)